MSLGKCHSLAKYKFLISLSLLTIIVQKLKLFSLSSNTQWRTINFLLSQVSLYPSFILSFALSGTFCFSLPFLSLPLSKYTHSCCPYPTKILLKLFVETPHSPVCGYLVVEASVMKRWTYWLLYETWIVHVKYRLSWCGW